MFSHATNASYGLLMGYKYSKIICKPIFGAMMVLFASPFANIRCRIFVNDAHYFYFYFLMNSMMPIFWQIYIL